jgi:hypothetical protein
MMEQRVTEHDTRIGVDSLHAGAMCSSHRVHVKKANRSSAGEHAMDKMRAHAYA